MGNGGEATQPQTEFKECICLKRAVVPVKFVIIIFNLILVLTQPTYAKIIHYFTCAD
jgi:hypothetical protein